MIYAFINSFIVFFFQSLLIKQLSYKLQNDQIVPAFVMSAIFFGFFVGAITFKKFWFKKTSILYFNFLVSILGLMLVLYVQFIYIGIEKIIYMYKISHGIRMDDLSYAIIAHGSVIITLIFLISFFSIREFLLIQKFFMKNQNSILVAMTYFGSLAASLFYIFLVYKNELEILASVCVAILGILMNIVYIVKLKMYPQIFRKFQFYLALLVSIFVIVFSAKNASLFKFFENRLKFEYLHLITVDKKIDFQYSSYISDIQKIELLTMNSKNAGKVLYLDGSFQLDTTAEKLYHQPFASFAKTIVGKKFEHSEFLILGGGDGFLAAHLFNEFENPKISLVDIDPKVIEIGKKVFNKLNENSLEKVDKIFIDDAFLYLRKSSKKVDGIFLDFPDPHSISIFKLYSSNIYKLAKKNLTEHGFIILDFSSKLNEDYVFNSILSAGFGRVIRFGKGHSFIYADQEEVPFKFDHTIPEWDIQSYRFKSSLDLNKTHSILKPSLRNKL